MGDRQDSPNLYRRRLLQTAGLAGVGFAVYAYQRGIRYPVLSLESAPLANEINVADTKIVLDNFFETGFREQNVINLRAFAPEPRLEIQAPTNSILQFELNNIANDALLVGNPADVKVTNEKIRGISRSLTIKTSVSDRISLEWQLPPLEQYNFAAIGDTGAGLELAWCIQRAHQLGARFLLHLGDFNYRPGDYEEAIRLFREAPLPCYVSIGNHDFHDSGLIRHKFLRGIGPLNHQFSIGNTRYVNLDTAANTFPVDGGQRGELMQQLIKDKNRFVDTVAFSHRPLHDPRPDADGDHDIGSNAERDWLVSNFKRANIKTLLSGHIHIFDRSNFEGIDNIIVGQGLGHQDLIVNDDHSKMALGQVDREGRVSYEFAPLAMPMEMHCHPRTDVVKRSLRDAPHAQLIEQIDAGCGDGA